MHPAGKSQTGRISWIGPTALTASCLASSWTVEWPDYWCAWAFSTFAYDWKKKTLPGFTASANNKRKHRSRSCASGTASVTKWSQFQQSILILSSSHGIQLWRGDTNPKSQPKAWFSSHNSAPTWTDWLISPHSLQVNFKFYSRSLKYHFATKSRSIALHAHWNKLPYWVTPGVSALLNRHWTNGNLTNMMRQTNIWLEVWRIKSMILQRRECSSFYFSVVISSLASILTAFPSSEAHPLPFCCLLTVLEAGRRLRFLRLACINMITRSAGPINQELQSNVQMVSDVTFSSFWHHDTTSSVPGKIPFFLN